MRAVVVGEPGGPDALTTAELPDPVPGAGQVVVAVDAAGVNPVDLGNRSDARWSGVESPYVVGYEFAGTVAELDGAPTDLIVGDPVWGLLPVRGTRWGAYAERVAVDVTFVARRPASLELVQLAAIRGLRGAAVSGAADRERLLGLGAELWVDRSGPGSPAADAATRLGHNLDAAVDLVGGQLVRAQAHVRDGGRLATVVDLEGDFGEAIDRNLSIHGVLLRPGRDLLDSLAQAVVSGLRPAVRGVFDLAQASVAHERLEAGGVGGKLALTT